MRENTTARLRGTLVITALLTAILMVIAWQGATTQATAGAAGASHNASLRAPQEDGTETEHPEGTRTVQPTETEHPEGTWTAHATRTEQPEGTETEQPEATRTAQPSETEQPEATETERPEGTEPPEATRTAHATETEQPEGTRTPEATETEHPEGTHTPEATETERPEGTRTAETSETPHATHTPEATETEQPEVTGTAVLPSNVPGNNSATFRDTGKVVKGIFLDRWQQSGGVAQQGYPISNMMQEKSSLDGKVYTVQYFERAVFEYHPENNAPYNVLLSQLGTYRYKALYPNGATGQTQDRTGQYFPETKHWVGGVFLQYWKANGGLMQQGYPISDQFMEVSALDGKPYLVQYFERSVFELHPENKAPYNVLLSQLGTFQYNAKYSGGR